MASDFYTLLVAHFASSTFYGPFISISFRFLLYYSALLFSDMSNFLSGGWARG